MRNDFICRAAYTLGALAGIISGCSSTASDRAGSRGSHPAITAGASGAATGSHTTTPSSGAGHAASLVPPPSPTWSAAGTTGTQTQAPPAPNTAISHEPIVIDDCGATNPAGISAADAQKLKAGGVPGASRWLYPYEGTVFPRGMLAPDLMWDGAPADAVYLHIKSKIFEYAACLKPTAPGRITLSQDVWDKAGERSSGRDDDYLIELSTLSVGMVSGPLTTHIQIAQAPIKGSIYYNTYRTALAGAAPGAAAPGGFGVPTGFGFPGGGAGSSNGVVVRIPAGGRAEVFGQTACNGCHSVSADGSRLVAQSAGGGALSYALVSNGPAPTPTMAGSNGCWSAVYPDGSAALSMSTAVDVARAGIFGGLGGGSGDATLFDTTTGQKIASTGIPPGALMPFFSPDGAYLVFNDYAIGAAHGIALTRYDTKLHAASEYTVLFTEPAGAMRPAWPFVLPDDHGVVFVRTDDGDFTGGGVGVLGAIQVGAAAPYSELSVIDIASKTVTLLAKAMGYNTPADAASGTTYLPFGAEDVHHAFYPTVSPVGAGGYFWVFFDSVRHYGNLGLQRQLWGAAVDISADGTYIRDPSHPAFYVSGQEFGTGNHRAFAALDPCRADGDRCTSGVDCCGGFCYIEGLAEFTAAEGTCSPERRECSHRDERCVQSADCCPPSNLSDPPFTCIAGVCTFVRGPD